MLGTSATQAARYLESLNLIISSCFQGGMHVYVYIDTHIVTYIHIHIYVCVNLCVSNEYMYICTNSYRLHGSNIPDAF